MGHEDAVGEDLADARGERREGRCVRHHLVGDADQALDVGRNGSARIDQAGPAFDDAAVLDTQDRDLGDAITYRVGARGLDVDDGQRCGRDIADRPAPAAGAGRPCPGNQSPV